MARNRIIWVKEEFFLRPCQHGPPAGPRGPYLPIFEGVSEDTLRYPNVSLRDILGDNSTLESTLSEFRRWSRKYYSKWSYREIASSLNDALRVLQSPAAALDYRNKPDKARRKLMFTIYAFLKFLREIRGLKVEYPTATIRRILKLEKQPLKLLDYVEEEGIVDKAVEILDGVLEKLPPETLYAKATLTTFFTGLRWPEVRFLINNYVILRKLTHREAVIVELNYLRKTKNAYVTILPIRLHRMLAENTRKLGVNSDKELREVHGVKFSILRKAHLAILSQTMNELEIDLLQGRISPKLPEIFSEITREHYVKHLRRIAEKYLQAYQPYINKYLR